MSKMKQVFGILLFSGLMAGYTLAADDAASGADAIKARIAPVDQTCMSGDKCAAAPAAPVAAGPRSGKDVFDTVCHTCHAVGLMGAPKFGNAGDWAPRAAKGLETLYTHALGGFNSMPPKGTCATCSDDEIKGAVKYMVDGSK